VGWDWYWDCLFPEAEEAYLHRWWCGRREVYGISNSSDQASKGYSDVNETYDNAAKACYNVSETGLLQCRSSLIQ